MPSGGWRDASGMACTEEARDRVKASAISLITFVSRLFPHDNALGRYSTNKSLL